MLQRIYGFAFSDDKRLKDYLHLLEEAERRDHRKLGRELDLFFVSEYGLIPYIPSKRNGNKKYSYWSMEKGAYTCLDTKR